MSPKSCSFSNYGSKCECIVSKYNIQPVQPIGSRYPIEQNYLSFGITLGSFSTLGGSSYGRISTI